MKKILLSTLFLVNVFLGTSLYAQVVYDSVNVVTAGTLGALLGTKKTTCTSLKISGKLNGSDIGVLREMTGYTNVNGTWTYLGCLRNLNLYYAKIVAGGNNYQGLFNGDQFATKTDIITESMFEDRNLLETLALPKDVKIIETSAFENSGLKTIDLSKITSLGSEAFRECYYLESIVIPTGISEIMDGTFIYCGSLTTITIPANVKSIGSGAFEGCTGLKVVNIENGVQSISNCFNECKRLSIINCKCLVPPKASSGNNFIDRTKCKLYIPEGTYYSYWLSLGWGDIPTILEESVNDKLLLTIKQAENAMLKQTVVKGDSLSLIFEPVNGWKVNTITFNGIDETQRLDANNRFVTPEITVNSVISVSYISTSIVVPQQNQSDIKIFSNDGSIQLKGVRYGEKVIVYNLTGKLVKSVEADANETIIEVPKDQIYLVKAEGNTYKVSN